MRRRRHSYRRGKNHTVRNVIIGCFVMTLFLATGYSAFQTVISINAKGNIKIDEECILNKTWEYDYENNKIYDLTIPCSGIYKLETWGAQGGSTLNFDGGYGGYSVGNISLKRKQKLYIVIGGNGGTILKNTETEEIIQTETNGYNGGSTSSLGNCNGNYRYGGGGGGATHISLKSGLLQSLYYNIDEILIVSGGGGGSYERAGAYGNGSSAGGYIGNVAYFTLTSHSYENYATGGTQSSGGKRGSSYDNDEQPISGGFGYGGKYGNNQCNNAAFGGAGFYGGGAGRFAPGAGGSSYIGNLSLTDKAMYCYDCTESLDTTSPNIFTISTTGSSNYIDSINCPNGYSGNPISRCAKSSNGYAKITLISRN